MKHSDFQIGEVFFASAGFRWLCTDKGTRTITAIMMDPELDASWFVGPPYMVQEVVFDELDFSSCHSSIQNDLKERMDDVLEKSTWFFSMEEMKWLFQKHFRNHPSSLKKLLKHDRVHENGHRLHPGGIKNDHVHAIDLLTREKVQMPLEVWRQCALALPDNPGRWSVHPKDIKNHRKKKD